MSFQKMILCGEIVEDPELRYTQSGIPCCAMKLKTVDSWVGADGQVRVDEEVHRVIVWRHDGEKAAKELKKGQTALVEGKNKTRRWMSENGVDVDITEVIAVPGGVKNLSGPSVPTHRAGKASEALRPNPPAQKEAGTAPLNPQTAAPAEAPKREAKASPVKPKAPEKPKPDKVPVDVLDPQVKEELPW